MGGAAAFTAFLVEYSYSLILILQQVQKIGKNCSDVFYIVAMLPTPRVQIDYDSTEFVPSEDSLGFRGHFYSERRIPRGTLFSMKPIDQMTYLLQLISDGHVREHIVRLFYGDEELVKLLITSLQACGFLSANRGSSSGLYITKKGKSRLSSNTLL